MKMTSLEIMNAMNGAGVLANQVFVPDEHYVLPELGWLRNGFARALKGFFHGLEIERWTVEQNDCDDFARGAALFASMLHHRSAPPAMRGAGIAFGEFWYVRDVGGAHAVNCAWVSSGGAPELVFFEPQNVVNRLDPMIRLSTQERMQCLGYRF